MDSGGDTSHRYLDLTRNEEKEREHKCIILWYIISDVLKDSSSIKGRWALNSEITILIEKQNYKTTCVYYLKKKKKEMKPVQKKKKNHTLKRKSSQWYLGASLALF